jgi:DNA polymerase-3 subunit beta
MALNCTVSKDDFLEGLSSLQNITNKKGTLAILSNFLIETTDEGLCLTGTDLEVGMKYFIKAQIEEKGKLTLPSKKVYEIVRESGSKNLSIEETENCWVTITSGLSTYNLAGLASLEYPEFPEYDEDNFLSFSGNTFLELIDKTIYSIASEQENIYSLTSVLFEKELKNETPLIRIISSDGHRLSIMEKEVEADLDKLHLNPITLIPKKGIQELKRFCENKELVDISFEKKQMVIKDDKAVMVIRLKQGEFPLYRSIVDAIELRDCLEIKRIPFLESLKRIDLLTEDIFHTIQLKIEDDKMILSSNNVELGNAKDEQEIKYSGEPLLLGFNCRYFIETLQVMEGETIQAFINSNNSPCLIKSDQDEGFISIIMPMQL